MGDVCKSKKFGYLDVRDIQLVNLVFLSKCRWRLLSRASDIWCDILTVRYGVTSMTSILDGIVACL